MPPHSSAPAPTPSRWSASQEHRGPTNYLGYAPKALHYAACSNWSENVTPTPNPIRHHTLPARVEPAHTRRPSRRPSQTAELPPHNRTASQWGSSVALEALIQGSFAGKRAVGPRAADKPQPLFSAREAETLNPKSLTLNPKHEPPEALSSPLTVMAITAKP
jgi:hypothetical protein